MPQKSIYIYHLKIETSHLLNRDNDYVKLLTIYKTKTPHSNMSLTNSFHKEIVSCETIKMLLNCF